MRGKRYFIWLGKLRRLNGVAPLYPATWKSLPGWAAMALDEGDDQGIDTLFSKAYRECR